MTVAPALQNFFEPWSIFLAEDPLLRLLQLGMLLCGVIAVFLVFYTTRDILLRSNSFFYMFFSILLVAVLPVVGFFLYLLIRPSRTIKERELEKIVLSFVEKSTAQTKSETKKMNSPTKTKSAKKKKIKTL